MTYMLRGVIAALAVVAGLSASARAELILNGGFETGNFSGWSVAQGTSSLLFESVSSTNPHSGTFAAELGNVGGLGLLSQTVNGLTVGASYNLSFWFQSDGSTPNRAAVAFGGDILQNQGSVPAFGYRRFEYTVTANATSEVLQFGTRNDPGFFRLDDVSLTQAAAVPEPSPLFLSLIGVVSGFGLRSLRRRCASE